MLGITLPGFRSCKPLAKAEWKTLGPQAIKETKLIYLAGALPQPTLRYPAWP